MNVERQDRHERIREPPLLVADIVRQLTAPAARDDADLGSSATVQISTGSRDRSQRKRRSVSRLPRRQACERARA